MRYLIHEGGNALQLPWSTQTNGRIGNYRVNYAEHHKRRTLEIEKHIDTQNYDWNGYSAGITGESDDKPILLATNDELVTHIFGEGTLLDYVVFHVKRAGSGTIKPFIEQDDGTVPSIIAADGSAFVIDLSKPGHYYGLVATKATAVAGEEKAPSKRSAEKPGVTSVDVVMTLDDFIIDGKTVSGLKARGVVDVPRGAAAEGSGSGKPVPYMTTDNGVLGFTFTAEKDDDSKDIPFDACMGIYMSVKDFYDQHACECMPAPCETEYPDPVCSQNRTPKVAATK